MKLHTQTVSGLIVVFSFLLGACQTTTENTSPSVQVQNSPEEVSDFREGPEGGVDLIWTPSNIETDKQMYASLKSFDKILLDPIVVSLKGDSDEVINPRDLDKLVKDFEAEIRSTLKENYQFVVEPGVGVLRVNVALTGVEIPSKVGATLSTVLPIGLLFSTVSKVTTGEHTGVGSATMEAILSDSNTGSVILAGKDRYAGSKGVGAIADEFDAAREAFKWWAERLAYSLERSKE